MDGIHEFDVSFDVMDAAIYRNLSLNVRGYIEFVRKELTHGSVVYELAQYELGGIGEIEIDKLSEKRTQVIFSGPRFAMEVFTLRQKEAFLEGEGDLKDRMERLLSKGMDQFNELFERRKKHYRDLISNLSYRLERDRIWPDNDEVSESKKPKITKVIKRGPQRYSLAEKLEALKEWDEIDKNLDAISLDEFLIKKFGDNSDGSPRVAKPTFHGWRRYQKDKSPNSDS